MTEEGKEEYEVEKIVDWYQDPDGLKYRIRWKGYSPLEDTEDLAENFAELTHVMRKFQRDFPTSPLPVNFTSSEYKKAKGKVAEIITPAFQPTTTTSLPNAPPSKRLFTSPPTMPATCTVSTTFITWASKYKKARAYKKALMLAGPGKFAVNNRDTTPWSLKKAKVLAKQLEPGVQLGYIPLQEQATIKWDKQRKLLIIPCPGSLPWVSHPDAQPTNPTNIGQSKYYHCHSCIGLTLHNIVLKSMDAWNCNTGFKWEGKQWFKREEDPLPPPR